MSSRLHQYAPGDAPPPPPRAGAKPSTADVLHRYAGVRESDREDGERDRPRLSIKPFHAILVILILLWALATSVTLLVQQSMELAMDDGTVFSASGATPTSAPPSPERTTPPTAQAQEPSTSPMPSTTPTHTPEAIDLNTADQETLESIKGIGPVTASSIIAYRDARGPFSSVDELVNVDGIGEKTLAKIRDHLTVR
ncbi:ComEA family DNA-binding protein [Bifidobacterium cuniculi]|uniref:Competence protein ComEA n=1 Tax=Bifidobacterium cuniculi TaxID=1688 RepID=A0A087AQE4_9BIFI|nr:ComEA family DNA-binding protein [Bifidobacterium cuniculi]KFI60994.1 competence protein ComEA [Bifidobacterium cuniculi]